MMAYGKQKIRVITFGEVLMRLSPAGCNKMKQSHELEFFFGGTEMNVAASLSQFGLKVDHVTNVSNDFVGDAALACMQGYGIGTGYVGKVDAPLGLYFMETGSDFRASQISYNRLHGAFAHIQPPSVHWEEILEKGTVLHWTGISPGISQSAYLTLREGLSTALRKGLTITADPAYRSNLWQYGKSGREVLSELVGMSTVLIGGVNEINELLGTDFTRDEHGFIAASKQIMDTYPSLTKVFDKVRSGVNASHHRIFSQAWNGTEYYRTGEIDIPHVIDRIGTGDAYAAGLIYAMQYYNDESSLCFANAACALKHTIKGDINLASVNEITEVASGNVLGKLKR